MELDHCGSPEGENMHCSPRYPMRLFDFAAGAAATVSGRFVSSSPSLCGIGDIVSLSFSVSSSFKLAVELGLAMNGGVFTCAVRLRRLFRTLWC
jgi:hypothetical protein